LSAIEAMPPSLLFAVICSYFAVYLFGMFSGFMVVDRNKMTKQIKEYQRAREKELNQQWSNNDWNHPVY
tara:strand:+ start:182 stop:388 length:207 start_codon:yes stop_codon:yes gene_type:complete